MDINAISKEQLKEYIKKAKEMETGAYYIREMIRDIDAKIGILERELKTVSERRWRVPEKPAVPVKPQKQEYPKDNYVKMWILIITGVILFFCFRFSTWGEFLVPLLALPVVIGLPVLIFFISSKSKERKERRKNVDDNNRFIAKKYREEVQNYPKKVEQYKIECRNYSAACRNDEIAKQDLSSVITKLKVTKNEISEKLRQAKVHVATFYSVGIVHPKYQGLVPMCRFYEYFDTGKCDSLKEAMLTYDNEVFQGIVIEKIESIAGAINSIQYELENIHNTVNRRIEVLSNSFDVMNGCLNGINTQLNTQAYHAQISAECNKQIADDVNTIRFYEDMRWIRS